MQFFCPRCETAIRHEGEAARAVCETCGFTVDLAQVETAVGQTPLPLLVDHTGETVGPYRLEAFLGSGGMGSVYRAVDTRNTVTVAVKLLFPQLAALPHVVARFHREASALRQLVHPRIVGYIDEGEADGRHYLAMDYVPGNSLADVLAQRQLSPDEALRIAAEISEALTAAHAQGIVHRDLKPGNIILAADGVRVLDFGIAQMTTEEGTLTHTDAILGTFNYMSPEQRQGGRSIDHRSDLFSLGVILYRMLTGELPLGAFAPVHELNTTLDQRHDRLLSQLLQPQPERRIQTARDLQLTLTQLIQPRKRIGRWGWTVAVVIGVALLVALWLSRGPKPRKPRTEERALVMQPAKAADAAVTRDGGAPIPDARAAIPDARIPVPPPKAKSKKALMVPKPLAKKRKSKKTPAFRTKKKE